MNPTQNIGKALEAYFEAYGLGKDGGLDKPWAKVKVGSVFIPFPNTASRKRALVFHDIHHLVTGYSGEWPGEVSIAGWEIGSGCNDYYAAWVLDMGLMALGIWIYPKRAFNGFVRGRRSRNLYHYLLTEEEAKQMTIPELQQFLNIKDPGCENPTTAEKLGFAKWWVISWVFSGIFFLLPLPLLGYVTWCFLS